MRFNFCFIPLTFNNTNNDGKLSFDEIWKKCEGAFPKIVVQVLMALCDSNGDKHINENEFSEFYKILIDIGEKNNDSFIAALFKIADRNHDGIVEEKELKLLHKNMGW